VDISAVRRMTGTWSLILLVMLLILMMMRTLPAVTSVEDLAVWLAFILLQVTVDMFHRINKWNAEEGYQTVRERTAVIEHTRSELLGE
jgi:Na+-transporting NADH:ubiquinone oxidoreductase subunit NqrB